MKCEQDVSNVWFVKFLYSLLGLPPLQQGSGGLMPELSLLRKHVRWGGVLTRLSQQGGEAAAGWPLTSERRSPSDWAAPGGVVVPRTRRKAAVEVKEGSLRLAVSNTSTNQSTGRGRKEGDEEEGGKRRGGVSV